MKGERSTDNSQQSTEELSTLILFINVIARVIRLTVAGHSFRVQLTEYRVQQPCRVIYCQRDYTDCTVLLCRAVKSTEYRVQSTTAVRGVVSPYRDISTSEGQRPGQSTAVLRSVDDIYITDARTVRPYRLGEYTTVQGEIQWILWNHVDKLIRGD